MRHPRLAARFLTILVALLFLATEVAAAHGGHDHADEGGFDTTVVLQVAGTAAAIGIAYLLAARIYRHRDRLDEDR